MGACRKNRFVLALFVQAFKGKRETVQKRGKNESSKKSVATVKKSAGKAVVTAKKAGTATITIKSTRGTNKIKLTIKVQNTYSGAIRGTIDVLCCDSLK